MKLDIRGKAIVVIVFVVLASLVLSTFANYVSFKRYYMNATLASNIPLEAINSSLNRIINDSLWILLILFALTTAALVAFILRAIINPIKQFTMAAGKIAGQEGDLGQVLEVTADDEIGDLAGAFNLLIRNMYNMVKQLRETADAVSGSAQGLSASTQEMNASTQEISSTLQQISKGVTTQARRVEETSRAMEEMMTLVKQVAASAQTAAATSAEAAKRAQIGGEATEETVGKMNRISTVVTSAAAVIQALGERSKQIGEIISVITSIADQTNMLALNAAIEAARAGEAGRGFAVVAEEVRKLAEGSAKAADQISKLIKAIQSETDMAVTTVGSGNREVAEGKIVVNKAGEALSEIIRAVQKVSTMVSEISTVTQRQLDKTGQVVKTIDEIAQIAEESASATEEASASAQQQTASMQEMASGAQELATMSTKLRSIVAKFRLSDGGDMETAEEKMHREVGEELARQGDGGEKEI
ncbi:MAG: HAMP domain-containing methyl-accepting chemotaxis protein [bacterium]